MVNLLSNNAFWLQLLFNNLFCYNFSFQFGSLFGNRFFSLYSEGCILGTDQKCPDYQCFLNFQFSYMLRDTLGALPSVQIMQVSLFSSVLINPGSTVLIDNRLW